ncbi:DUF551 domain-containing protein [Pseudescherichia sp.]|uniref:DUF551 domain-containing protein n=1 Tax=Pseudescherichia sp. TaxID=2055881 RepID=UPI002896D9B0|nr:DUF551 domain-containing protein [Pseudescherichia sp.]
MSEREQFEAWAKRTGACSKSIGFNKCIFPGSDVYDDPVLQGYWSAWQASREALKAEQGNDGWIACADRMPEEGGRYWCYVEEQNSLGKSHYQWNCSWNGDEWGGEALSGRVTHWMPLPLPPAINHPIDTTPNQYDALGKGGEQ